MELSMKRSGIACCEKVFEYAMPVEQAAETVVPDTMPDVERILCAEGMVIIRSKEVSEGRVTVSGMRTTSSGPTYRRHASPFALPPPRWHRSPLSR
mgnify:CR=1 FL=1